VRKLDILSAVLIFLFAAPACLAAAPVKVYVSILPQKYFVEKIGGELVDVSVLVKPGASPATYEPKPKQMVDLAKTRVYFAIGVPFEKAWLDKIASTNASMLVVHTEVGIEKIPMKAHHQHRQDAEQHHQESAEEHDPHLGVEDPHVWLSPPLVMVQARNILQALVAVDPAHRARYEKNASDFIMELVALNQELREILAVKAEGTKFMVFHPSWGYFAHAYGLEQVPIEIEGKEPKPAELEYLILTAKQRGIKVVFVQPQFSSQTAETIARHIGGKVAFADPLAANWADNLREVAAKFGAALR
jgi:zinc transport system substrate-binding protein